MDLGLRDRVAIVTASSKGLGRGSALALAREGARLVICARGTQALAAAEAEIAAVDPGADNVVAVAADVTDPAAAEHLVSVALGRWGRLDVVVANAGGPPPARSLDLDDDAMAAGFEANFYASVRLVRASVVPMRDQGWGRICLITSSSIKEPIPTLAMSNTARTALWAWAKTAAGDLAGHGVTLNAVCPGLHDTDRIRGLGIAEGTPMGDPEDFGRVVAFVCSEPAAFVNGTTVTVDGGAVAGLF